MTQAYHLTHIRTLLTEGCTVEELCRLCYDDANFRPVYQALAHQTEKVVMVERLLKYAEQNSKLDKLLAWVKLRQPAQDQQPSPAQPDERPGPAQVDLSGSQGAVVWPAGPVTQHFGDVISATGGSTVINRSPGASVGPPAAPSPPGGLNYTAGLERLRALIEQHAPALLNDLLTLEARLRENLRSAGLFGEDQTSRSERARIVAALNDLAQRAGLGRSFNELAMEQD